MVVIGKLELEDKPPLILVVAAVAYMAYLAWLLMVNFAPVVLGRFALSGLLFFFVLRGSRVAGNILAVLCGLSALIILADIIAVFPVSPGAAAQFGIIAGLLAAFSAYLFFSPGVRAFQGGRRTKVRRGAVPGDGAG
ncbi:hypothetical protein [Coralloluteibacterium thermophilus]|uniref:Uncharacterized protein n=1 Tax=Coralloluteibacterium thermophilum TaxID=2707049 RepID=A0ABV9NKY4_9GAMM